MPLSKCSASLRRPFVAGRIDTTKSSLPEAPADSASTAETRSTSCASSGEKLDRGMQPADAHRLLGERNRFPIEPRTGADELVTILLAERDPFSAELSEYLLRTEGYATRVALDAGTARAMLEEETPSLVVIDLLISGGTGRELCRLADERAVPVVAVSAIDSRDQALQSGADAFLLKPLDPLQFVSTVRDLLGTSAYLRRSVRVP